MGYLKSTLSLCSVVTALAVLAPTHGYGDEGRGGPFLGLAGQWSGAGTVTMADGSTKRLRCRSANVVNANGRAIEQNLHCASGRFRLDLTSNVISAGGLLSGSWGEAAHGVQGDVFGLALRKGILAHITGMGFAARMYVRTKNGKQSVNVRSFTLRPPRGTDVANITVALQR